MNGATLLHLIDEKIAESKYPPAFHLNERITLGIKTGDYKHTPEFEELKKKKKRLFRSTLVISFLISLLASGIFGDGFSKIIESPLKGITVTIIAAAIFAFIFVIWAFVRIINETSEVHAFIRTMILKDLRNEIEKQTHASERKITN